MIPAIEGYRKQLARHLRCCKDTQARLLDSFDKNMLFPLLEVSDHPSEEELHTAFGTPAEAAALLMEQLSEEEAMHYRMQQRLRKTIVIGAVAAVVVATLLFALHAFFWKDLNIVYMMDSI